MKRLNALNAKKWPFSGTIYEEEKSLKLPKRLFWPVFPEFFF